MSCKKDKTTPPDPEPTNPVNPTDTSLKCVQLPPTPVLGWRDSSANADKNINAFFFNPLNTNEIIFVANGDLFGYNKMYNYNIVTKQIKYLFDNGSYLPRVNDKGWIVFSRFDDNIYKIKVNGDSLTQLTTNNLCQDAKWDRNGNHIFFYQTASALFPTALVEINKNGVIINTTATDLPNTAFARKTDRIAYLKTSNTTISIYYRNIAVNTETLVISKPGTIQTFQTMFNNLTFDNTDENLYWSNDLGIFRCNIFTSKIDTLLKNCSNIKYDHPLIAANSDEMTLSCHIMKPLNATQLLHQYKAYELNLNSRQLHEVRVFPQ